jgi:hypothetical protein
MQFIELSARPMMTMYFQWALMQDRAEQGGPANVKQQVKRR